MAVPWDLANMKHETLVISRATARAWNRIRLVLSNILFINFANCYRTISQLDAEALVEDLRLRVTSFLPSSITFCDAHLRSPAIEQIWNNG
jgi:hypothetical protein